jgi:heptosyltransferase-2
MANDLLIVKSAALGDVLRTTSLLPALQKRRPWKIWWLTSPAAADLLKGNKRIHRVVTLASLPRRRFDLVLSLEEEPAFAEAAQRLCRGRLVGIFKKNDGALAYTASSARYYDMSLLNRDGDGGLDRANALKQANRLTYAGLWTKVLGLSGNFKPQLELSPADRRPADVWLKRRGVTRAPIGLNAGAGARWPAKQFGEEQAARLARALAASGRAVVLLGGNDERARNARIAKASGALIAPVLKLRAFAGLVERCAVVVTTDSLALHVASALGRPVVVAVGPTSCAELDVFGKGAKLVPASGCACYYRPKCSRARHCLEDISSAKIVRAAERWL